MPKHTLFVCKSCHRSSEQRPENQPVDGTRLLDQLNSIVPQPLPSDEFEIQAVGCLWACDRGCIVAFSAPHKPTYLFTDLQPTDQQIAEDSEITMATALKLFGELYLTAPACDIPYKQFPEELKTGTIAKIPPLV